MKRRLIALFVLILLIFISACAKTELMQDEESENAAAMINEGLRKSVLYMINKDGYVVPFMKYIPWEEAIGRAVLMQLTGSGEQETEAGLSGVLPANTQFTLDIRDRVAYLSIDSASLNSSNKAKEQQKICCIVNTLIEFPAIETVQILPDGKKKDKLKHGTNILQPLARIDLNVETDHLGKASKLELYFVSKDNSMLIPVTRFLAQKPDLRKALEEQLNGPLKDGKLKSGFPEGTKLLDADVIEGIATINFSREFSQILEYPEMELDAIKTLFLICKQFEDIEMLEIKVEGEDFPSWDTATVAQPVFVNEF